jgi:putative two-component system response regulator
MKILVVDDDSLHLAILGEILRNAGYEVVSASSGKEALGLVESVLPDLVISDVIMDGIDGFDLAHMIKQLYKVPVILLTILEDRKHIIHGLASGADEFLPKPLIAEELLLRVRNILRLKEYQNSLEAMVTRRVAGMTQALKEVGNLNREMIFRLLSAAEVRDDDTGTHIIRVAKYCCIIAQQRGFQGEFIELLETAATMHDLGKIGIPDKILLKPGQLTPQEFDIMKTHTNIGSSILEGSNFPLLNMSCDIALSHHERWDGAGYPQGLKGTDIPIFGRIVAIADVFDALMSKRVYKPAFSFERSVEIIKESRGKNFDPSLVDAFLKGIDEIKSIGEEYKGIIVPTENIEYLR